jgi:hypothetical protein
MPFEGKTPRHYHNIKLNFVRLSYLTMTKKIVSMKNDAPKTQTMIKKNIPFKLLSLLTFLFVSIFTIAQTTITIGTGTSTSSGTNPSNVIYRSGTTSTYRHAKTVHILTQAQLSAAGLTGISQITKWGYEKGSTSTPDASSSWVLNVYLKNTTATALSNSTPWSTMVNGATLVYSNIITSSNMPATTGFWDWTLNTPFIYNGGAIECYIEFYPNSTNPNSTAGSNSGAFLWKYTNASALQAMGENNTTTIPNSFAAWFDDGNRFYNTRITHQTCTLPTNYSITGGGMYCVGGTGTTIGLNGSQTGVNYQLKKDGVNIGSPVAGTGSAISFGNQSATGTYTIEASGTIYCTNLMSGNTVVSINSTYPFITPIAGTTTVNVGQNSTLSINAPTGGNITSSGDYRLHTFSTVGNATFDVPAGFSTDVEYLVVAGGGGGGGISSGAVGGAGGGGAGGYRYGNLSVTPQSYSVTVGNGGTAGANTIKGGNGGNSVFASITSTGGGGGGSVGNAAGSNGGSGGGASYYTAASGIGNTPATTPSQGNNGGSTLSSNFGAGGGGAAGAGQAGGSGGMGGAGLSNSISGVATYYAGGGSGGVYNTSTGVAGGIGGGGSSPGGRAAGANGTNGLGGGGGAASGSSSGSALNGGTGGSGIVMVRYFNPLGGTWTSDNPSIATVDANGVVSGVSGGTTLIHYAVTRGGCTTEITTSFTVIGTGCAPTSSTLNETACGSYTLNNQTYTSSNTYTQTIQNVAGCDSTITLNLIINNPSSSTLNETACGSYTLNNQTYTSSNTYTQIIQNAAGCDSTITLNLIINNPSSSTLNETACGSYTLNNQTYTSSNTYTQIIQNAAGCDSTITLNLTINNPSSSTLNESACGSYTLNNQTYTSSNTYTQVIQNAAGCDSTITLNLTIKNPSTSTLNQTACGSYTLNNQTYTSSNTYTQVIPNTAGCDSTITLNLTIVNINNNVANNSNVLTANQSNATYQWINCANNTPIAGQTNQTFSPSTNGSYAVEITMNNCTETSSCVIINNVSLEEDLINLFKIFPNPANDVVTIQSNSNDNGNITIKDVTGKTIYNFTIAGNESLKIDLTNFSSGLYFIDFIQSNQQLQQKLIKK